MLATVISGLALQSALENNSVPTRLQTAIKIEAIAEPFIKRRATRHLEKGSSYFWFRDRKSIFYNRFRSSIACDRNPCRCYIERDQGRWFTTKIRKNKSAVKFDNLSFDEVLKKGLKIMDTTAFTLSQENKLPIIVFDINIKGNLSRIVQGEKIGTRVDF